MQQGSGVILVFLHFVAARHGCGESSACAPTIATVGTSRDRTGGCEETRITQLSQTAQQGTRATGQVKDTRVIGKPDKCDGSEKAWPNLSSVAKAYAGAIDQQLSDDMTKAEISTTVLNNDSISQEAQAPECAAVFHPDHAVYWTNIGSHRQCGTRLRNGSVASARPRIFLKNNARLVVMMLEVLAFPLDTNDVVNGLETMERKIKEFERHANVDFSEFLKVGIVIRQTGRGTNENAPHHECAQVDDVPGHQSRSDECQTSATCVMTKVWTRSRRDRPKELPKVLETAKTSRSCAGTAKIRATDRQSAPRDTNVSARENRQVRRKAMATVLEKARNGSKANVLGGEKSGHMSKDCRS